MSRGWLALALLLYAAGCDPSLHVSRSRSPSAATREQSARWVPVAIDSGARGLRALPAGTRVERDRAVLPEGAKPSASGPGVTAVTLGPKDVIEVDERDRIVAVRTPTTRTAFVPGSAVAVAGTEVVRGVVAIPGGAEKTLGPGVASNVMILGEGDRIVMEGEFEAGDSIPGGGSVQSSRFTAGLVSGLVLLGLTYPASAYVGASSSRSGDRALVVPVLGPWIDLAGRDTCVAPKAGDPNQADVCLPERVAKAALAGTGLAQAIGAVLLVTGLPSKATETQEACPPRGRGEARLHSAWRIGVLPMTLPGGGGVLGRVTF